MPLRTKMHGPSAHAPAATGVDRRQFLQQAAGLTLGLYLGSAIAATVDASAPGAVPLQFMPNAFVRIGLDNSVAVIVKHLEMGQGVFTGLATVLAEELDADWREVLVQGAPADVTRYANLALGIQATVGSTSMANSYQQMRKAGATVRALLVTAAAQLWHVPADSISVADGLLSHPPSGRRSRFGPLTAAAARLPLPLTVRLKDPSKFRLIGSPWVRRTDCHAKTNGSALFTQDLKLPGMLVALAAHPARFGATLKHVDATAAKAIAGVVDVVQFPGGPHYFGGVAVLASNTWIAQRGRDALGLQWDQSQAATADSDQIRARYRTLVQSPGTLVKNIGDASVGQSPDVHRVEAMYELPYLAHAAMEPMNCLVQLTDTGVSIWNGEQLQTPDQIAIGQLLGIPPEQVHITQLYAGGSFGRRANPQSDYLLEAVSIARAAAARGHHVPIKLVWMREDDMRAGYYRPAFLHRIQAAIDAQGTLVAWQQHAVGQSIMAGVPLDTRTRSCIEDNAIEDATAPYEIPNVRIELTTPTNIAIPVQWWRGAGHSHIAFATECMLDELAAAAGKDAYRFRRALLKAHPRQLAVLDLAATKAGWSSLLTAGPNGERRGRGIALHESFGTCVAQVAEVSVAADGSLRVDRVVCAVDCGIAINPNIISAQMEGGIGFGLGAALHGDITVKDGVTQQSDFDRYTTLRIHEMPAIEVYIVPSHEPPTGIGGPAVPPIAPALANAIYSAIGKRIRRLPIAAQLKTGSLTAPEV